MPGAFIQGPYQEGKCLGITGAKNELGNWKAARLCSVVEILPESNKAIYFTDIDFFDCEFKFVYLPIGKSKSAVTINDSTALWFFGKNLLHKKVADSHVGYHFFVFRSPESRSILQRFTSFTEYLFGSGTDSQWVFALLRHAVIKSCEIENLSTSWNYLIKSFERFSNSPFKDSFLEILQKVILHPPVPYKPSDIVKLSFVSRKFYGTRFPDFLLEILVADSFLYSQIILKFYRTFNDNLFLKSLEILAEQSYLHFGVIALVLSSYISMGSNELRQTLRNFLKFLEHQQLPDFSEIFFLKVFQKSQERDFDYMVNEYCGYLLHYNQFYPELLEIYSRVIIAHFQKNRFWGKEARNTLLRSGFYQHLLNNSQNENYSKYLMQLELILVGMIFESDNFDGILRHIEVLLSHSPISWLDTLVCDTLNKQKRNVWLVTDTHFRYLPMLDSMPKFQVQLREKLLDLAHKRICDGNFAVIADDKLLVDSLMSLYRSHSIPLLSSAKICDRVPLVGQAAKKPPLSHIHTLLLSPRAKKSFGTKRISKSTASFFCSSK